MFRSSQTFDKILEKSTSQLLLEPDWASNIQICDIIRQGDVNPKYAVSAIKKKIYSQNPNVSLYALQVLETVVKNCGSPVHDEIATKQLMEDLREFLKNTSNEKVRELLCSMLQVWSHAFRNDSKYRAVQDTVNILRSEGYKFPQLKESDAMFDAHSAPKWTEGDSCYKCRSEFGVLRRRHHCRNCGQIFCDSCSSHYTTIPKFGIEKDVRVCDPCWESISKAATNAEKPDTAAAQPQETPQSESSGGGSSKSDATKEEEELQLAIALSKSEAESNEKHKLQATHDILSGAARAVSSNNNKDKPMTTSAVAPSTSPEYSGELQRYMNRSYWEEKEEELTSPTHTPAPTTATAPQYIHTKMQEETLVGCETGGEELEEFISTLRGQLEIFVNRMKSNSSRGRSIANDSSVQTLFMNITAMHSQLLTAIQHQDDKRVHYEGLQDKTAQIRDARAALDALREEHREKVRREQEEVARRRQLQMAHKLHIMRQKKQEYLEYQRQMAMQRIQEQEWEMQMRQEQQKQMYTQPYPGPTGGQTQPGAQTYPGPTQPGGSTQPGGQPYPGPTQPGGQPYPGPTPPGGPGGQPYPGPTPPGGQYIYTQPPQPTNTEAGVYPPQQQPPAQYPGYPQPTYQPQYTPNEHYNPYNMQAMSGSLPPPHVQQQHPVGGQQHPVGGQQQHPVGGPQQQSFPPPPAEPPTQPPPPAATADDPPPLIRFD